jgi:integrase
VNPRKPWYRKSKDAWFVEIDGRQHALGKHPEGAPPPRKSSRTKLWNAPDEIQAAFRRLLDARDRERALTAEPRSIRVRVVCDRFLTLVCPYFGEPPAKEPNASDPELPLKANATHDERTYWWYRKYLQSFCDLHGALRASELKPLHLTAWLEANPGWQASRRHAIIAVKRCFKWADEEGLIDRNPFRAVKKPAVGRRERILTPAEKQEILQTIRDRPFREFVFALYETGCRPSEVARVTAENFDEERGLWVFQQHKARRKTGKPRIVYLTPAMVELTKALVARYPEGPLFRGNRNKKAFTRNGIRCRFRRLRKKLPHLKGVVSYTARHTYTNEALCNGVGLLEVAELLGHSSTEMVEQHYAHLDQKTQHMLEAAKKARAS